MASRSSSSRCLSAEEEQEVYSRQMVQVFGPLNNPAPKKADDRKKRAGQEGAVMMKRRRTSDMDTSEPRPYVVNITNNYFGNPTPEQAAHTEDLVSRTLEQVRAVGEHLNLASNKSAGPSVDEPRMFKVINVPVRYPEHDVHNGILRLLSAFGIECDRKSVMLEGQAHAMPRLLPKLFHSNFAVPSLIADQIDAVLAERELCETGTSCVRLCIKNKMSYTELLEKQLLEIGWSILYERIAPIVPTIHDNSVVYPLAELPNTQIIVTIRELLKDAGVIDVIEKKFNQPARRTIREWRKQ